MTASVDRGEEGTIRRAYELFNRRDLDALRALMTADVAWPDALGERQLAEFDPRVEPLSFEALDDGRVRARVRQTLLDLAGDLIGAGEVFHDYSFRDGLIARMEIVAAPGG